MPACRPPTSGAAVQAEIYDPAGAVEAGYLDRVVPAEDVEPPSIDEARRLGELPAGATATRSWRSASR